MSRIKIDLPEVWHFQTALTVQIGDINYGNHLGNDAVLRLAHEARLRFLHANDYTEMDVDGAGLIMADAAIQFQNQAFYGDELTARLAVTELARAGFALIYLLERGDTAIARIKTGMVFYDYAAQSVTAAPERFRERFAAA